MNKKLEVEYGFCAQCRNLINCTKAPFNPFAMMQQCVELVRITMLMLRWCARSSALRIEAEECSR